MPSLDDGEWEDEPTTTPFDEANLGVNPQAGSGVEQSSAGEPHRTTQAEMSESEISGQPESPKSFDPKVRQSFEGLLYLGKLESEFSWLGHSFLIRTLTSGDLLEIGKLHKPYVGTVADVKAYQAAVVASSIVYVDDKPVALPITNEPDDTVVRNRFNYILRSWYPPVIDKVYEEFLLLENQVQEVISSMGEASG